MAERKDQGSSLGAEALLGHGLPVPFGRSGPAPRYADCASSTRHFHRVDCNHCHRERDPSTWVLTWGSV